MQIRLTKEHLRQLIFGQDVQVKVTAITDGLMGQTIANVTIFPPKVTDHFPNAQMDSN